MLKWYRGYFEVFNIYIGLAKKFARVFPYNLNKKTWMNFLVNPILWKGQLLLCAGDRIIDYIVMHP